MPETWNYGLLLTQGNVPKLSLPENTNIVLSEVSALSDENTTVMTSTVVKPNPPKVFDDNLFILLKNSNAFVLYYHVYSLMSLYTIWVIDQAWARDGWILAKFFFCIFMNWDGVEIHKHAKVERGQYPAILTAQACSLKALLYGIGNFFLEGDSA